ncbi:hypothetical protein GCM10010191_40910 [Actinomadura vinacea]|uniref:Uncharacterized protein n=1 Tax=Actinomadura vinacea TaxID=115336 RepID=A0ABN3J896_9ACTN
MAERVRSGRLAPSPREPEHSFARTSTLERGAPARRVPVELGNTDKRRLTFAINDT